MRVCIIGSSHVAAIKSAWDIEKDSHPGVELTFFAGPGGRVRHNLKGQNGSIIACTDFLRNHFKTTSEGKEEIVVSDYDAFIVVGIAYQFPLLRPGLSRQVREAAIRDSVELSPSFEVCKIIRERSSSPIILVPRPLYPEDHPEATRESEVEDFEITASLMNNSFEDYDILFSPPPKTALTKDSLFTKSEYMSDAQDFDGRTFNPKKNRDTQAHMGERYGALLLNDIFYKLSITINK